MKLNKIQIQIFIKLAQDQQLEVDDYLKRFSRKYVGRTISTLENVSEDEGDAWITKAYLESLA